MIIIIVTQWRSLPWEANSHRESQEIPHLLWKLKVYHQFTTAHNRYLSWARRIRLASSYINSLTYIIIVTSYLRLGLPSSILPSCFPIKNCVRISHLFIACFMPHLSHPPSYCRPNNIIIGSVILLPGFIYRFYFRV